ncbi:MAG: GntR family transcriptional regulator [Oscillospiraceae bacterium]|nr:GntR family transcriptional regulator [Oscillospiraceae bacterium]
MNEIYKINSALDVPIYKQLVDSIRMAIRKGDLSGGHQLPTVQELTQELGIARGTVKRAYDELEQLGLVEKAQGRGTFVCYQPSNSASRKEQAMAAIDAALDQMENLGFSMSEINIFLNLKLQERAEKEAYVKVAVVECNPETLSQISEQLRHINGVDLYPFLLDSVQQYPYKLAEDYDLIVTTANHSAYLESIVPVKKKVVRVALRLSATSLSQIIKLRSGKNIGIVAHSRRFGDLLYNTCLEYTESVNICPPTVVGAEKEIENYLQGKDAVLVTKTYENYYGKEIVSKLQHFQGAVIDCAYEMDEGSVLYLETKIGRLLENKKI